MRPITAAALLLAASCVPGEEALEDDGATYADVLPDGRMLVDMPAPDAASRGSYSESYLTTAEVTSTVNHVIAVVLFSVDYVTDFAPTAYDRDAQIAVWGPFSDGPLDPVETLLWVQRDAGTGAYTWAVEQRVAADPTWTPVIVGEVDPGASAVASSGRFTVDFSQISAFDPLEDASGLFSVEYVLDPAGAGASVAYDAEPVGDPDATGDALYEYVQIAGGDGSMDLAMAADATGNGVPELQLLRSQWNHDGAGRADHYVTGGDVGELLYQASECWDDSFASVYYTDNYSLTELGDAARCAFLQAPFPGVL